VEAGGATAIVIVAGALLRIDLGSGAKTVLYTTTDPNVGFFRALALEPSGSSALVVTGPDLPGAGTLLRVDLTSQSSQTLAYAIQPKWVAIESEGSTALVSSGSGLFRLHLATGRSELIARANGSAEQAVVEAGGTTAVFVSSEGLHRVDLLTNNVVAIAP